MKTNNKNSYSFIDFLVDIANECFFANGSAASPHDVNFANHMTTLYNFEKNNMDKDHSSLNKITMNKKSKSIVVDYNNLKLSKEKENAVKQYCENNSIQVDIKGGRMRSVTINTATSGVVDDRDWKKEL